MLVKRCVVQGTILVGMQGLALTAFVILVTWQRGCPDFLCGDLKMKCESYMCELCKAMSSHGVEMPLFKKKLRLQCNMALA